MIIGILKEGKEPVDRRVPLTPEQCKHLMTSYRSIQIIVQKSDFRCFSDQEYINSGVKVVDDISEADILLGIKEVPKTELIPHKIYFYFSHTIKKQPYNKGLLCKMIDLNIKMIDYEVIKDENGKRLIGFGRYAGIIGAYNALLAYGIKSQKYNLDAAYNCFNKDMMLQQLINLDLNQEKIVITGSGKVALGAIETLCNAGITEVNKQDFLSKKNSSPVFLRLDTLDYNIRKDSTKSNKQNFYDYPEEYISDLARYLKSSDIFISGHFYSIGSPVLLTKKDLINTNVKVIADISCDINGPIASTIRSSSIIDPIYGYNTKLFKEDDDLENIDVIAVMAVDNLPCELPKDSSEDFGNQLIKNVFPLLINDENMILDKATICEKGALTRNFTYLSSYISGD
ncbi:MAG: NAD(P)-dependent oxidoreductase [Bacteroidota bacterium]|nr:NAD(P)-dependent oxidoreductase [Bacteroidota bacterium]